MRLDLLSPYELMGLSILALAVVLVLFMVSIMLVKIFDSGRQKKTNARKDYYRDLIARVVKGDDVGDLHGPSKNDLLDIRNIICDMVPNLKGVAFTRVQGLYTELGLALMDLETLKHIDPNKRLRALNRLEKLKIEIPYETHLGLLDDSNDVMRLLATLLLIHNHKKRATPVVMSFLEQRKFGKKGFLFYIIQEIGKIDKAAIPFMFERAIDPDFEEALLMSANITPPPRFDDVIYRKLTVKSAPFVIVWSLRVLMHYPSRRLFTLIDILKSHSFWAVRLEVAKCLHLFEAGAVAPILEVLTHDENYLVRLEATTYAAKNVERNKELLNRILLDEAHPAKDILQNIFTTEELKAA